MSYNQPNLKAERGLIKQSFDEIRQAIIDNNGAVIDDHMRYLADTNYAGMIIHPHAIAKHGDDTVLLHSEAEESSYFCLNRMYIDDDGIPHLSKFSVGCIVNIREHGSLDKAVESYNHPSSWMPGFNYTKLTDVFYFERELAYV